MKGLTQKEKEQYHSDMNYYVKILNDKINSYKGTLYIGEVGYGVPIENNYFYFDYPYSPIVDKLNNEVSSNESLKKLLEKVFEAFFKHDNDNPYIHYKYTINEDKRCFTIYELDTNIEGYNQDIINFLAIAHFNIYIDSHYLAPVKLSTELAPVENIKQIIYVVKYLKNFVKKISNTNKHLLTLTMYVKNNPHFHINYETINFIYDDWLKLLEVYFNTPIMKKVLIDSRTREVLSYQHNIYNLRLPVEMGNLREAINKTGNENLKSTTLDLHRRYKILRLMLFFTFKVESFDTSGWEKFPLADINICDIIEYFSKELTPHQVKTNCNYSSYIWNHKTPRRNYLSPITQVLWNLWTNAQNQTTKQKNRILYVSVSLIGNDVQIIIKNEGMIPIEYLDYINLKNSNYPEELIKETQYKGLQIVKFLCLENDWSIQCKRSRIQNKTIFTLILKGDIWKS